MKIIAKVRYVDFQKRSHTVEVESDSADRRHLEDLIRAKYPAEKVYFHSLSLLMKEVNLELYH